MEFFGRSSSLCSTCLSVDRKMIKIEELYDVYQKVIADDNMFSVNQIKIDALCWECHAYLRKIQKFQKQVRRAQELLSSQNTVNSLSNLATYDYPNIDIKQTGEIILKHEREDTEDNKANKHNAGSNIDIDNFFEQEVKIEVNNDIDKLKDGCDVKIDNIKLIPKIILNRLSFNFKDVTCTKIVKETNGEIEAFEEWEPNKKTKKVQSKKLIETNKSTVNVQEENQCLDAEIDHDFEDDEKYDDNVSIKTDIENSVIDAKYNIDISESIKKTKKCIKRPPRYKELMKPKYRFITDINEIFNKKVNETTPNCVGNEIIDENEAVIKKKDTKKSHLSKFDHTLYECKACGTLVESMDRKNHLKHHKKVFQCIRCDVIFNGRKEFFKHYDKLHKLYICNECGKNHQTRYSIKRHIRGKHTAMTCEECAKKFSCYRYWKEHHSLHHQVSEPAYCVECDQHFPNQRRYQNHLQYNVKHKRRPKKRIQCPDCDKVFTKRIHMIHHHRFIHLKQYDNKCEQCDKNFVRRPTLIKHIRQVHEGIKAAKNKICYMCGRGFTCNDLLTRHLRTHTGERPYACDLCPARFTQEYSLTTHRRTRHPEASPKPRRPKSQLRPFACELCRVFCSTAERLDIHKRDLHLLSKPSINWK